MARSKSLEDRIKRIDVTVKVILILFLIDAIILLLQGLAG